MFLKGTFPDNFPFTHGGTVWQHLHLIWEDVASAFLHTPPSYFFFFLMVHPPSENPHPDMVYFTTDQSWQIAIHDLELNEHISIKSLIFFSLTHPDGASNME